MAAIGARTAYVAKITTEEKGQPIVYDQKRVLGEIIETVVTPNYADNPLYAGDAIRENDNGMTGGTVSINTDHVEAETEGYVLGYEYDESKKTYRVTDSASPYVGYAYVQVLQHNSVVSYKAVFLKKVQFALQSQTARTKENTITWQTPTLAGNFMGVNDNADGKISYEEHGDFATLPEAEAWIDSMFGSSEA